MTALAATWLLAGGRELWELDDASDSAGREDRTAATSADRAHAARSSTGDRPRPRPRLQRHTRRRHVMSTQAPAKTPDSPAWPGLTPTNCMLDGWECAVQDADVTRGRAMSLFASETGERFTDITCRVAYMRLLTRQESYEYRPLDDVEVVPDDWEPDEGHPVWAFCGKGEPGAIRCWRLAIR